MRGFELTVKDIKNEINLTGDGISQERLMVFIDNYEIESVEGGLIKLSADEYSYNGNILVINKQLFDSLQPLSQITIKY